MLDSQRQLFNQESAVATARSQASQALVMLYRALGGGWDPDKVDQPPEDGEGADGDEAAADGPATDGDAADGDAADRNDPPK